MVTALRAGIATEKLIPLVWNHSGKAEDLIGYIDPASVKAIDGGVIADGWIDLSTPRGAEAWRLIQSRVLGFSFGFVIIKSTKRPDGIRVLDEVDVFEISATPTPIQSRTRVISWKAEREPRSNDELQQWAAELGIEPDPRLERFRCEARETMFRALGAGPEAA